MLAPSFVFMTGLELLLLDLLRLAGIRAPVPLSSIPRKGEIRPAIYLAIEDVTAVDGGGGTKYRERLNRRYEASAYFRRLIHLLSLFWSVTAVLVGSATAILVLGIERNIGYVVCSHPSRGIQLTDLEQLVWVIPFIWAAIWAVITIKVVKYELATEEQNWPTEGIRGRTQLGTLGVETTIHYCG